MFGRRCPRTVRAAKLNISKCRLLDSTANCIIIAQFPIENHSTQGQFAELRLKPIGKVQNLGDYYAIRSSCRERSDLKDCDVLYQPSNTLV